MDINDLYTIGIVVAVTGIALAFALQVTGDVQDDMTADTAEYNATGEAIDGIAVIPEKLPTVATIGVAVVIIGLLAGFFVMRGRR